MEIQIWLAMILVIEIVAIFGVFWYIIKGSMKRLPSTIKVGVLMSTFGLGVQVVRTVYFLQHGHYPTDSVFPWWVLKDLGISVIILYYVFRPETRQG
jgi:hypothetical protein